MSLHLCSDGAGSLGLATVRRTTATAAGHDTHPVVCPVSRKTKKKSVKTKNKKKKRKNEMCFVALTYGGSRNRLSSGLLPMEESQNQVVRPELVDARKGKLNLCWLRTKQRVG